MKRQHFINTPRLTDFFPYFLLSLLCPFKWKIYRRAVNTDCAELFASICCHLRQYILYRYKDTQVHEINKKVPGPVSQSAHLSGFRAHSSCISILIKTLAARALQLKIHWFFHMASCILDSLHHSSSVEPKQVIH